MSEYLMILGLLENSQYIKRDYLAMKLSISKRKVQMIIDDLNYMLTPCAKIESKTGAGNGYYLIIEDRVKYQSFLDSLNERIIDRELLILKSLLINEKYCKVEELAEELYISERFIRNYLKSVKATLEKYDIHLITKPHYGMTTKGTEKNKRLCLANEIFKSDSTSGLVSSMIDDYDEKYESIKTQLESIILTEDYKIHDFALNNLIIHIIVAIYRILNNQPMNAILSQTYDKRINKIVLKITTALEQQYGVHFEPNECDYIALHLLTKEDYSQKSRTSLPEDVCEVVLEMLKRIDHVYHTKLHLDFELCMSLSLHFIPLLSRIEHQMNLENPIINEIKRNYIYEYELACEGAEFVNERFKCRLSDDEIGYITLDIRLSLTNRRITNHNKILVVCSTGRGSSEILRINFLNNFGKYIDTLDICSLNEISKYELDSYDYIFTTVPFNSYSKTPVFLISNFLHHSDVSRLQKIFNKKTEALNYFDHRLFIKDLKAQTKEEVIHLLVEYVKQFYKLPDDFEQLVLKRESLASTAFGNDVAFPHPYRMTCDDTFICIATLKKPIEWKNKRVKIVMLAAISKKADENIQHLYEALAKIINYQENIDQLIVSPTIETVYEILSK